MEVIDPAHWGSLAHAYGRAVDTPHAVEQLRSGVEQEVREGLEHLWSAVLHQGTPWAVTPHVAMNISGLLTSGAFDLLVSEDQPQWRPQPLRAHLIDFLSGVAEAGTNFEAEGVFDAPMPREVEQLAEQRWLGEYEQTVDQEASNLAWGLVAARAHRACRDIAPELLKGMLPFLDDANEDVRISTQAAMPHLLRHRTTQDRVGEVADRLRASLDGASEDERASIALTLGQMGLRPLELLHDAARSVRVAAALAPALKDDDVALAQILDGLTAPPLDEAWFEANMPHLFGRFRFDLVATAIDRCDDLARLLPAAVAVLDRARPMTVDFDWGPLLVKYFPSDRGETLTSPQRAFLAELVRSEGLWDPRNGNAHKWFQEAGLPRDRKACRRIARRGRAPRIADTAR